MAEKISREILAAIIATIPSGGSLSGAVPIEGASMGTILMPAAWTAADLTFQHAESKGGTFVDATDESGTEIALTVAASKSVPIPPEVMVCPWIKIRSGTSGTPVNQDAARELRVVRKG